MKKQLKLILIMLDAHNNLGIIFKELGKIKKQKIVMKKQLKLILIMLMHHNNLGKYLKN